MTGGRTRNTHRPSGARAGTRRRRTKLAGMVALPLAFILVGGVAWAYWTAGSVTGGNGASAAVAVNPGATPTASATGSAVTVSWPASTLSTGQAVNGYLVRRYDVATHTSQTMLSACTGTIAALACTESTVPDGQWVYTVTPVFATNWRGIESANSNAVTSDSSAPTVTINQAAAQADPTNGSTVNFTAVFSETVTGFATGDVTLTGTAGATTGTITGSGTTYDVAVTGMTSNGTIIATVGSARATDAAGNNNTTSTSTDNTVTRSDTTAPVVTITSFVQGSGRRLDTSGTAGILPGDSSTVTVVLCATNTFPCSGPNTRATLTTDVDATTGAWSVSSGNMTGPATNIYARASQTDVSGNTGNSSVAGPVAP